MRVSSASAFGKITGSLVSAPANSFTGSIESNLNNVTNSTSSPSSLMNNSAPRYPLMLRAAIEGKISSRNISSYAFAFSGFVQPCQTRAIIGSKTERKRKSGSHAHDLVTAIDVNDLTSDRRSTVACQENSGRPQLSGIATAFQWRAFLIMFQHGRKPADAASCEGLNGSGRNAIHANFFRPQIVRKITHTGF